MNVMELFLRAKAWLVGVSVAVISLAAAYVAGHRKASQEAELNNKLSSARADQAASEEAVKAIKERQHVDQAINGKPSGTAADRLRDRWSR